MSNTAKVVALDESGEDGEEEVYELEYDEDEEQAQLESSQGLSRSKPGVALDPVNEEVKEMKSVDEETNNESDASGTRLNLQDVNEITTPPVEDDSHE